MIERNNSLQSLMRSYEAERRSREGAIQAVNNRMDAEDSLQRTMDEYANLPNILDQDRLAWEVQKKQNDLAYKQRRLDSERRLKEAQSRGNSLNVQLIESTRRAQEARAALDAHQKEAEKQIKIQELRRKAAALIQSMYEQYR